MIIIDTKLPHGDRRFIAFRPTIGVDVSFAYNQLTESPQSAQAWVDNFTGLIVFGYNPCHVRKEFGYKEKVDNQ